MKLPAQYIKAIGRYEPIRFGDVVAYPILMDEYEEFLSAKPAIEAMQQTFKVRYAVKPLLSALYAMDMDSVLGEEQPLGLFNCALAFLALSLRLGRGKSLEARVRQFRLMYSKTDPTDLQRIAYTQTINGKEQEISISPVLFSEMRPVLAAQNGIELIDEADNPELVQAERDIAELNCPPMKQDIYAAISTVATFSHCDESEINSWPILKFDYRRKAIQRSLDYVICSINEGAGCKFKGGNPCPSPFFDKLKTSNSGLMALSSFAGGQGEKAVMQQMATGAQNAPPPEFQQKE